MRKIVKAVVLIYLALGALFICGCINEGRFETTSENGAETTAVTSPGTKENTESAETEETVKQTETTSMAEKEKERGVFIGGVPASCIVISDISHKDAALLLRDALDLYCGTLLEIKEGEREKNSVYFSSGSFGAYEVYTDDTGVMITSSFTLGTLRGTRLFVNDIIKKSNGEIDFTKDFSYNKNVDKAVYYSEFGAAGDGVTDDFGAIMKTHIYANENKLNVFADSGGKYYIGALSLGKTAVIKTNTDWTGAEFIIDDTLPSIEKREHSVFVFSVKSYMPEYTVEYGETPRRGQKELDISLNEKSLVKLYNSAQKIYIRTGENANNGSPAQEVVIADKGGILESDTPITWDYTKPPVLTVFPIDTEPLYITGGVFTTIKNNEADERNYYTRGILINRSNVTVSSLTHLFGNPEDGSAPYRGFVYADTCSGVTVRDCLLTPCRYYKDENGKSVGGGYDIGGILVTGFVLERVKQTVSVTDDGYWGIFALNFARNVKFDSCVLTRFDAHMGVYNAEIKNCTLGHQGINAIGFGLLYIENTTVCATHFINLRSDYGSTWRGDIVIKNCALKPCSTLWSQSSLIACANTESHNYGYTCYMPETVKIDGFILDDTNSTQGYNGIYLLGNYNPEKKDSGFTEKFPYAEIKHIYISGFESLKGCKWKKCANPYLFQATGITEE